MYYRAIISRLSTRIIRSSMWKKCDTWFASECHKDVYFHTKTCPNVRKSTFTYPSSVEILLTYISQQVSMNYTMSLKPLKLCIWIIISRNECKSEMWLDVCDMFATCLWHVCDMFAICLRYIYRKHLIRVSETSSIYNTTYMLSICARTGGCYLQNTIKKAVKRYTWWLSCTIIQGPG